MKPTPYRAGNVAIGIMYRQRPPQYANSWWEGHVPMKRSTRSRLAAVLLWTAIGLALFVFCTAVLVAVHPAIFGG